MATPYELRFDMYNAALDRQKEAYYSRKEEERELQEKLGVEPLPEPLKFPTPQTAIAEANVIMAFVNGKD